LARLDPTPNIDRIGKEGIVLDNCFCVNSICTPSRANIITGQYSKTNGVLDLDGKIDPKKEYLPIEMKKLGYQTAMIGKWHLKNEPSAFDYYCVLPGQGVYFDPIFMVRGTEPWPENTIQKTGHSTDVITDLTLDWLKHRDKSKPFFLMNHFKAPHDLWEFAPRYKDYLKDTEIPEPASMYYDQNHGSVATRGKNDALIHDIGSSISHRNTIRNVGMKLGIDQNIPDPQYASMAYQEYLKRYLRCVKGVDDNVKRILDYLQSEGILDNTIIIYTADQGIYLGEHDYYDKRWMYEESMRMPFLVRYPPLIKAGTRTDALINNTDFAPTIIDLAGGSTPDYMQGKSFKTILEGQAEPSDWRTGTYYRYWMHMAHGHANPAHFGIRTKDYKLIFFYGIYYKEPPKVTGKPTRFSSRYSFQTPAGWEFYDLKNDSEEMDNRYGDPKYAQIISDLRLQLKEQRSKYNLGDEDNFKIQKIIDDNWDK